MNVLVEIDGREAIPVRVIPLLTDWETMSPDVVAHVLAWDEDYVGFAGLQAFHAEDVVRPIPATWWDNIACRQLKALSESIKSVQVTHETGLQDWRRQSLVLLPAGVFVWKDEFEPLHCQRYGPDGETVMTESGAMPEDEHARRAALNFEPFIPDPEIQRLVMEGFEQAPARVVPDLSGRPVIALPAGTASVDVSDIPRLIAVAMYPRLLAQDRLPAGSKELPEGDSERSRHVQLYNLERKYHSESALAIRNGIRGLAGGLVVRSKQTRSPFITDGDITDAYATVDDFKLYVNRTYDMDVCLADAVSPTSPPRTVPAPVKLGWTLWEPKRYQGYSRPLYLVLNAAHRAGTSCPKARDVLDAFKEKQPPEVINVHHDGITYYDSNGNSKAADLAAISEAIRRMTTPSTR